MPGSYSVSFDYNVPILMRDGITTYADVFRPQMEGPVPALLQRTPYDKSSPASRTGTLDAIRAASHGYAVVIQDVRGRYLSEGEFYTFFNEINDGHDTVEWIASQPWCSGKVGMFGVSYVGATQWLAAKSGAPSLTGIAPGVTASNYQEGWAWQGGAFELGFNLSWGIGSLGAANWGNLSQRLHLNEGDFERLLAAKDGLTEWFQYLPMKDMPQLKDVAPYYYDWLDHPEYDDYWQQVSIEESHADITVPAYNFGGWYDIFLGGTIRNYERMRDMGGTDIARSGQRLTLGPWIHGGSPPAVSASTISAPAPLALQLTSWGDTSILRSRNPGRRQRFRGRQAGARIRDGENVWRYEDDWPLSHAVDTDYYLHSRGKANSLNGDGTLSPEQPGDEPPTPTFTIL